MVLYTSMRDKYIWAGIAMGIVLTILFALLLLKFQNKEPKPSDYPQERTPIEQPAGREPVINSDPKEGFLNDN